MRPKKYKVYLQESERNQLKQLLSKGKLIATLSKRAHILLNLDETQADVKQQKEIAKSLSVSALTVSTIAKLYVTQGFNAVMQYKKRETPAIQPFTGDVEARIIALACSTPPEGRSRWTLRLLEQKVVELEIVDKISDSTIYRILKKHR